MAEPTPPPPPRDPAPVWNSVTHHFDIAGHDGYIIAATERGVPIHIEIRMAKEGGTLRGLLDSLAACVCLGLERGVPLSVYTDAMEFVRFEPGGHTPRGYAHSIVDYVFRWLRDRFIYPGPEPEPATVAAALEGETCSVCGAPRTWAAGDACPDCGHVD